MLERTRQVLPGLLVAAVVLVVSAYPVVRVFGLPFGISAEPEAPTPPPRPQGARDSLNPGIWIEGGTFLDGSHHPGKSDNPASPYYTGDERPPRRVAVEGFWIQEHEVTNREYRRFDPDHDFPPGEALHPVVDVTWREAMAYASRLGGTLPTEAQWEYAAEGSEARKYPWGDAPPTCERAQFGNCDSSSTVVVLSRPDGATPEGVHGLAGNAWEWVTPSWFVPGTTPVNEESRGIRGGSFRSPPFFLRASNRSNVFYSGTRYDDIGFRVAWSADR